MHLRSIHALGVALAIGVATAGAPALGASDGNLGASSLGELDVTLTIPQLVRISDLDDIDLGTFAGSGLSGSDNVCVWSTTRAYAITASGDGTGGSFTLTGATSGSTLAYTLQWAESAGAGSGAAMTSGQAIGGRSTTATSPTCNGGTSLNATVLVAVSDTALGAAVADTYTGTVTLLVEPE